MQHSTSLRPQYQMSLKAMNKPMELELAEAISYQVLELVYICQCVLEQDIMYNKKGKPGAQSSQNVWGPGRDRVTLGLLYNMYNTLTKSNGHAENGDDNRRSTSSKSISTTEATVGTPANKKKGMVLPFDPHSITFDDIIYSVDMPQVT